MSTLRAGLRTATVRRGVAVVLCISAALVATACGSSSATSSSASTGSSTTAAAAASTTSSASGAAGAPATGLTTRDISTAHAFVGGKLGKATGSPIDVGFVANDTGPTGQPYLTVDNAAALSLVNNRLDGIDGHPIELVKCNFGGTPQQGQNCGSQFANNPKIKLVLFPGGTVGSPQMHAAIDGRKVVLCTAASPPDYTAKNTFCTAGDTASIGAIATYLTQYAKAKTVSILSITDPTLESVLAMQKAQYGKLGLSAKIGFTDPTATDVTSQLIAAGVQSSNLILLELPLTSECPVYDQALKQLNVTAPVLSLGTCEDPSVKARLGDLPKWTYFDFGPNTGLPDPTGQVSVFLDATKSEGTAAQGQNATQTFGTALLMAKIFNELGPNRLTTSAIAAKLHAFTGPAFLGDPHIKFGVPPFPSVGTSRARFFTYLGQGKWKDATGGKWVSAPAPR